MADNTLTVEQRLARLEKAVFGEKGESQGRPKSAAKASDFSGPTGGVRFLVSKNFFKSERGLADVRAALEQEGYRGYVDAVIQTALNRQSARNGPLATFKKGGKKVYVKRK
jgi:hypothetical protein